MSCINTARTWSACLSKHITLLSSHESTAAQPDKPKHGGKSFDLSNAKRRAEISLGPRGRLPDLKVYFVAQVHGNIFTDGRHGYIVIKFASHSWIHVPERWPQHLNSRRPMNGILGSNIEHCKTIIRSEQLLRKEKLNYSNVSF
jgi:hypothetical protein